LSTPESRLPAGLDAELRSQSQADVYKGLQIYIVTLVVLTALAWCVVGIRGAILHESYPRNTLFFRPEIRFSDFLDLSERVPHWREPHILSRTDIKTTYAFPYPYPYPTPSFYIFVFFVWLFPHPLQAYLIFVFLSFLLATCFFSLRVKRATQEKLPQIAIWSTLLLGFPLQFLVDRGNIEAVIWVLILLGAVAYARNRMLPSAILWSIAAAMKIFPGLIFMLFIARRKFGTFVVAIASTVAFSLLALAAIGPTIHQAGVESSKSAAFLMDKYIIPHDNAGFDHSLFQATKQLIYVDAWAHKRDSVVPLIISTRPANEKALGVYNIVIPLAAILLYWFRLRRLPLLNQFIAYIVLCVLLPYIFGEYTLVHMYTAWAAFLLFLLNDVATARVRIPARAIHTILFSYAVIFVPLTYLEISGSANRTFAFGAQVKTIFLVLILLTVLRIPMPSSLFGDLQIPPSARGESERSPTAALPM
jgi:hypothetical protein